MHYLSQRFMNNNMTTVEVHYYNNQIKGTRINAPLFSERSIFGEYSN